MNRRTLAHSSVRETMRELLLGFIAALFISLGLVSMFLVGIATGVL